MKRNLDDKVIGGVCSGLADSFEINSAMVRLAFILAFWFFGAGPLIYIILWIILPGEMTVESLSCLLYTSPSPRD